MRIHQYLIDVYEAELPLKPFDRELFLSRLTMRQEIAYHTKKLKEAEKIFEQTGRTTIGNAMQSFKYISYAKIGACILKADGACSKQAANKSYNCCCEMGKVLVNT